MLVICLLSRPVCYLVDVHELEAVLVHVELLLGEASLILAPDEQDRGL